MTKETRPLSPHLSVYRWQVTNTLSIIHRLSGVILYFGGLYLSLWIAAVAFEGPFSRLIVSLLDYSLFNIVLVGLSFVFFYHSLNGIRHLFWDVGKGFEPEQVRNSGITMVLLTLVMTGLFWWFI
ncbi:MAG: succinate dehydrogenase, cytochrome b556 subunit [Gammaproteobacteria bacterium]|jgi:succinate dehydrogenase / fumarate reductase cytochrome b subunit|nr:succinate dehydrogenase, cytochrome b556 subunit [Gammaproteobacteria bacterium]MBQ09152.1 succinate dehydrogenase, cytochrome b556 subunit [Gammaproteobacteria bacterium]MDP6146787.1 succinate dehydrogenase, cytochrome b556 subunit [Gammaproteobacteria bacterium]HJL80012.1 succinate dehydrogenase, cytochrome b556 subunit [Gammaproteobacteria bacterium]HJM09004.1 succinate dehydrogenase, cytochrome b556 subunit [Gammaproteobacteria bacterium]|tara:strand:- start:16307 stop:16681 length:375 start_codon:yes stop_codon:yes gene_type:complete